jgi:sortase A
MTLEPGRAAKGRVTRGRARVSIVGIVGEVFITAGVLVLLFLGWQVWLNDLIVGNEQNQEAAELSETWDKGEAAPTAPVDRPNPGEPVVSAAVAGGVTFANIIIPRFGADYSRPVAEGVTGNVLSHAVGHYPDTQMPGGVGNLAIAGHRTTHGAPFSSIDQLQVGDSIYLETELGWYRYVFRSLEYVYPTGVGVIEPVPQGGGATPTDRILTMTSCNPKFSAAERIIAYSIYDTWYPRADGAPPELSGVAQASAAG